MTLRKPEFDFDSADLSFHRCAFCNAEVDVYRGHDGRGMLLMECKGGDVCMLARALKSLRQGKKIPQFDQFMRLTIKGEIAR